MAEPCLDLGYPGSQCSPPPGHLCLSLASVLVLSLSQALGSWSRSDFRGPGIIVLAPKVQSGAVTRDQALTPSSRVLASPYRCQPPLPHLPREEGGRGQGRQAEVDLRVRSASGLWLSGALSGIETPGARVTTAVGLTGEWWYACLGTCHPRHWADNLKTLWSQIL